MQNETIWVSRSMDNQHLLFFTTKFSCNIITCMYTCDTCISHVCIKYMHSVCIHVIHVYHMYVLNKYMHSDLMPVT
jgi:hypothetical protein